ncbi:HNH endonuclease signature motif containing protein [Shumkonia mesophila]|uniref:HNH endonuclease signature motif containing protein n=1 Tax=Shumkonia mesophila TaxID=2838854 RepID=UPI002934A788|nr:HNH endonuclease signature motif containing protein [Shumkonia mesophila]
MTRFAWTWDDFYAEEARIVKGRGRPIPYSTAELDFIEARRAMIRRELHALFVETFGRTDVSPQNFKALCSRKGWSTGRTGQFPKGHVPANKGQPMPYNPNSARTRFKKGQLPRNTRYAGHERVSKDGYVEISIEETNPHTGFERRYVLKHRWLWEKKNGPVPVGMALKCLDGNRQNTDPSNWKPIPRAMLPRLGGRYGRGYDAAPAEVKPSIMAVAELEHRARQVSARPKNGGGER